MSFRRSFLRVSVSILTLGITGCLDKSCPPQLHVHTSDETEVATTDRAVTLYQDLSKERQQEFLQALENRSYVIDDTKNEWSSTYFVKYKNNYYTATVAVC